MGEAGEIEGSTVSSSRLFRVLYFCAVGATREELSASLSSVALADSRWSKRPWLVREFVMLSHIACTEASGSRWVEQSRVCNGMDTIYRRVEHRCPFVHWRLLRTSRRGTLAAKVLRGSSWIFIHLADVLGTGLEYARLRPFSTQGHNYSASCSTLQWANSVLCVFFCLCNRHWFNRVPGTKLGIAPPRVDPLPFALTLMLAVPTYP